MLLQRHKSLVCRKKHRSITKYAHNSQAQRVFKTAPLFAQTNPDPTAPQTVIDAFTAFFESLWAPSTNPDGSTVQKAGMSYVYDEDGTLIAQTLTGGAQSSWGQSARYVYLPTASGPMPVAAIYGTKHYAIQSDHLNTPRRLIQSDGQVAWQWAYSAFGDEKPTIAKTRFANVDLNQSFGSTTVPAVTFNLRYPGQYFDQESGLHYNYHRSYSATTGRYTQSDPIGLDGGWNRYSYVGQNPLSFTDSLGLAEDGPWHPEPGTKAGCKGNDDCPTLKKKKAILEAMHASHVAWDGKNGVRHTKEIADLKEGIDKCEKFIARAKCDQCETCEKKLTPVPVFDVKTGVVILVLVLLCIGTGGIGAGLGALGASFAY